MAIRSVSDGDQTSSLCTKESVKTPRQVVAARVKKLAGEALKTRKKSQSEWHFDMATSRSKPGKLVISDNQVQIPQERRHYSRYDTQLPIRAKKKVDDEELGGADARPSDTMAVDGMLGTARSDSSLESIPLTSTNHPSYYSDDSSKAIKPPGRLVSLFKRCCWT